MSHKEFLNWLADRLVHVYGENPNVDFVHKLRDIAKTIDQDETKTPLPVEIVVTGPGSVINYEYYLIANALRQAGVEVDIINDHPPVFATNIFGSEAIGEYLERMRQRKRNTKVSLIARHCPWGA